MIKCAPLVEKPNIEFRDAINGLEKAILGQEGAKLGHEADKDLCPLEHTFAGGMYIRKILMYAGTVVTSKIHKKEHPYFVLSGRCDVITEDGKIEIVAPHYGITKAGTKRAIIIHEDTVWVTCHLNETNTKDLEEIESNVIANSFEEFDKIESNNKNLSLSNFSAKRTAGGHE